MLLQAPQPIFQAVDHIWLPWSTMALTSAHLVNNEMLLHSLRKRQQWTSMHDRLYGNWSRPGSFFVTENQSWRVCKGGCANCNNSTESRLSPAACVRRRRTSKLKSSSCCWRAMPSQKGLTCNTCLTCMPLSPSAGIFACNLDT